MPRLKQNKFTYDGETHIVEVESFSYQPGTYEVTTPGGAIKEINGSPYETYEVADTGEGISWAINAGSYTLVIKSWWLKIDDPDEIDVSYIIESHENVNQNLNWTIDPKEWTLSQDSANKNPGESGSVSAIGFLSGVYISSFTTNNLKAANQSELDLNTIDYDLHSLNDWAGGNASITFINNNSNYTPNERTFTITINKQDPNIYPSQNIVNLNVEDSSGEDITIENVPSDSTISAVSDNDLLILIISGEFVTVKSTNISSETNNITVTVTSSETAKYLSGSTSFIVNVNDNREDQNWSVESPAVGLSPGADIIIDINNPNRDEELLHASVTTSKPTLSTVEFIKDDENFITGVKLHVNSNYTREDGNIIVTVSDSGGTGPTSGTYYRPKEVSVELYPTPSTPNQITVSPDSAYLSYNESLDFTVSNLKGTITTSTSDYLEISISNSTVNVKVIDSSYRGSVTLTITDSGDFWYDASYVNIIINITNKISQEISFDKTSIDNILIGKTYTATVIGTTWGEYSISKSGANTSGIDVKYIAPDLKIYINGNLNQFNSSGVDTSIYLNFAGNDIYKPATLTVTLKPLKESYVNLYDNTSKKWNTYLIKVYDNNNWLPCDAKVHKKDGQIHKWLKLGVYDEES